MREETGKSDSGSEAEAVVLRPYAGDTDSVALYRCKRAFERTLGENTGGDAKATTYENKLTDAYRERWLEWVDRCVTDDERCVTVAVDDEADEASIVGYVFVLPERLTLIWDAAVINELYVAPAYRGSGVADRLLSAAVEYAADQSLPLERIVLDVDPANERARRFYARHGFDSWGEMVVRPLSE